MKTIHKLSELSVGDNIIIPIPQWDHAPTDPQNILCVVIEFGECSIGSASEEL